MAVNICFLVIILVLLISNIVILTSHTLYCYFFEHQEWKTWKHFIKISDKFEYDYSSPLATTFVIPNTDIVAYVWKDGIFICSIHSGDLCLCTSFTKHLSQKMAKLLMEKITLSKNS
jgi:cytochrome c biogenesis factor